MTGIELRKLVIYLANANLEEFVNEVYGENFEVDSYTEGKYDKMHTNTIGWLCELDKIRLQNLATAALNR